MFVYVYMYMCVFYDAEYLSINILFDVQIVRRIPIRAKVGRSLRMLVFERLVRTAKVLSFWCGESRRIIKRVWLTVENITYWSVPILLDCQHIGYVKSLLWYEMYTYILILAFFISVTFILKIVISIDNIVVVYIHILIKIIQGFFGCRHFSKTNTIMWWWLCCCVSSCMSRATCFHLTHTCVS